MSENDFRSLSAIASGTFGERPSLIAAVMKLNHINVQTFVHFPLEQGSKNSSIIVRERERLEVFKQHVWTRHSPSSLPTGRH